MRLTDRVRSGPLEITDLLWSLDGDGERRPVAADEVTALLLDRGQRRAAEVVRRLPTAHGYLDDDYVDRLGLRVHCELQRLSEELQLGRRVSELLEPTVRRLPGSSAGPVRVVDVGCGVGYLIRSLAAHGELGDRVELVGVDLNPVLVDEATGLAAREGLRCRFVRGDALRPGVAIEDGSRTIVVSTGLLHHLSERELVAFFAGQAELGVAEFAHWDIAPCLWSTLGAWIFHQARMRAGLPTRRRAVRPPCPLGRRPPRCHARGCGRVRLRGARGLPLASPRPRRAPTSRRGTSIIGLVAAALLALALLDASFSGFRASLGRTGLIRHRGSDVVAARRGAVLGAALLVPAIAVFVLDLAVRGASAQGYQDAGEAALLVFGPYAVLTWVALGAYFLLGWRQKYLASALVLGPFTLFRPVVVAAGSLIGILRADEAGVSSAIVLSALAVLSVEGLAGRRWYASPL